MKVSVIASIVGSIILGVAALLVAKLWLPSQTAAAPAPVAPQPMVNMVAVVVATTALPYGERLEPGKLAIRHMPKDAVPEGAFSTIDQIMALDQGSPLVLIPIAEREAILPAKISGAGARPSVATQITEGMRGFAIAVSDESSVGGNILPGDWVDVILARETSDERKDKGLISEVVLQNVRVLGIDLNSDPTSTKPSVPNTATLEVKLPDVQKLAVAAQLGRLSLALRRTGAAETARVGTIRATDVSAVSAGIPRATVAAAPTGPTKVADVQPSGRPIMIVAGGQANRVTVPYDLGVRR